MLLKMEVIGNLGKDAIIKDFNGKKVINFSIAHTEKFKNAQGVATEKTTWVECSMWEKTAVLPYLKQGQLVYIMGTPSASAFTDKEGQLKSSQRCTVFDLKLLGGAKATGNTPPLQNNTSAGTGSTEITEPMDDLPF